MVEVSRRDFLAGVAAAFAFRAGKQEDRRREQAQTLDGPVVINDRNFFCLDFDSHQSLEWEIDGLAIKTAIGKADFVMPEYDPLEYEGIFKIPVIGSQLDQYIAGNVAFYQQVVQSCQEQGKDIWMVDPAYTPQFAAVRVLARSPFLLPEEIAAAVGVHFVKNEAITQGMQALHTENETRATKILRSRFLSLGIASILAVAANVYEWQNGEDQPEASMAIENDFRRVMISELASILAHSDNLPKGANTLLLYPNHHWDPDDGTVGIKQYMQQPELRKKQLRGYLGVLQMLPLLGHARLHTPEHEGGNPVKIVSIPVS